MKSRFTGQIRIAADPPRIWQTLTQQRFVEQYLPEIQSNLADISSTAPYTYYQNQGEILPAYTVVEKTICWNHTSKTLIRLTRSDLNANISSVEIELIAEGEMTKVIIEVNYQPTLDRYFLLTRASIRSLFQNKLNVLKRDIESTQTAADYLICF